MTVKSILAISGALALTGLTNSLHAQTPVWSYSTGQDTAVGQIDHSVSGSYAYVGSNQWWGTGSADVYVTSSDNVGSGPGTAIAPGSSKFTTMKPNGSSQVNSGDFTFAYNFDNTSGELSGFFDMQYAVDDVVSSIYLNGLLIYGGNEGSWTQVLSIDTIPVQLLTGSNTLEVVVSNGSDGQWGNKANMSLAAEFQITSGAVTPIDPIPEPSTSLLSIFGVSCFVICGRSRRRN